MTRDPWYKIVTPRQEVREGRSFSPDEFAIALEQVVAGTAPPDYRDPAQFFSRTCFTRALKDQAGMVLRRLAGETQNTSPVLTLVTQFGGGKTHTLTALHHLANTGPQARSLPGVSALLNEAGISGAPDARVGVFVGNAWDPSEGRETPWIDLARQIAGDKGVAALGTAAKTTPPGTEAISRVFAAAEDPVLLLFDEVLNFINRHRDRAESFHAFIQNLTVAVTGVAGAAAVISLPRSQVEMTDWDRQWQDRITKVVRRVARDLIANDEAEIGDVVRRRLFEDLGDERIRRRVSKAYADWCFERTARLPSEWMVVDSTTTEARAREVLRSRFESCYPFHPSTLSVFRRKWSALAQFQQTRGTLAMLAQWVSWAARQQFQQARTEPLITLGSAPLHVPEFRAVVLGQLGEQRLDVAINTDIAGPTGHAGALDADTKGPLRGIHRRVGAAILFESSGGQVDKVAHLPELRFALGEPEVETTTVDTAAAALESSGFFIRKVGTDGFRIHYQATLKKVVSDRRAALNDETETRPAIRKLVKEAFSHRANLPVIAFPEDGTAIQDTPRLMLVVLDPEAEWIPDGDTATNVVARNIARWTRQRGASPRLYPASLVWCAKKPGRELRDRVERWLAWQRVSRDVADGLLGTEFDRDDRNEIRTRIADAENAVRDEVWGSYRFVALADALGRSEQPEVAGDGSIKSTGGEQVPVAPAPRSDLPKAQSGLRIIDLGAGHSSASETMCGRVVTALRTEGLLSETVAAGYLDRHWPPAFKDSGAWPLTSLRQSFLNGSLTRLMDPDAVLRRKLVEFVESGAFGLASCSGTHGQYERLWYAEPVPVEEVAFEPSVFLLTKARSEALRPPAGQNPKLKPEGGPVPTPTPIPNPAPTPDPGGRTNSDSDDPASAARVRLRVSGTVPPELWNRLGTKVVPRLRSGQALTVGVQFEVETSANAAASMEADLRRTLDELGLGDRILVERP